MILSGFPLIFCLSCSVSDGKSCLSVRNTISTSERHAEHPFAGRNTQHLVFFVWNNQEASLFSIRFWQKRVGTALFLFVKTRNKTWAKSFPPSLPWLLTKGPCVLYFDQQTSTFHAICWSKSSFSVFLHVFLSFSITNREIRR